MQPIRLGEHFVGRSSSNSFGDNILKHFKDTVLTFSCDNLFHRFMTCWETRRISAPTYLLTFWRGWSVRRSASRPEVNSEGDGAAPADRATCSICHIDVCYHRPWISQRCLPRRLPTTRYRYLLINLSILYRPFYSTDLITSTSLHLTTSTQKDYWLWTKRNSHCKYLLLQCNLMFWISLFTRKIP